MTGIDLVNLYYCKVPEVSGVMMEEKALKCLPDFMQEDILKFKNELDRITRIAARLLVRKGLQDFGILDKSILDGWTISDSGKPKIKEGFIDFSISHSGHYAIAAVAVGLQVGIDIETYRSIDREYFKKYFTDEENKLVNESDNPSKTCIDLWAMREAVLKANGTGLNTDIDSIRNYKNYKTPDGDNWQVVPVNIPNAAAYIACNMPLKSIQKVEFDLEFLINENK